MYPIGPGGQYPTTGRTAGGLYPLPEALRDAILSLAPTTFHWMREASGNLADLCSGGYTATMTGSPTYAVAAPNPVGQGITFSGTGMYATTSTSVPTPTASISVLVILTMTDATASVRIMCGRQASSQNSWAYRLGGTHLATFALFQSGGSFHATAAATGAVNDGLPHLVVGSFDGTTVRSGRDNAAAVTSTSLTGSWHTASTAAIQIAAAASSSLFPGTIHAVAVWNDRVITDTERLWLYSIMAGS